MGGSYDEVEVIDFMTDGERSCIGHQGSGHAMDDAVALMVGNRPTICGGGTDLTPVAECRSLDLETGHWTNDIAHIYAR